MPTSVVGLIALRMPAAPLSLARWCPSATIRHLNKAWNGVDSAQAACSQPGRSPSLSRIDASEFWPPVLGRRRWLRTSAAAESSCSRPTKSGGGEDSLNATTGGTKTPVPTYESAEDTIAAVVTGAQQSAVAIIRISGSAAVPIARKVFQQQSSQNGQIWNPQSHRVYFGHVVGDKDTILDEVLCLVMLSPKSYTCEDVVEFQCHGGPVCCQRVLNTCVRAGARLARPGEFTLRAFLNGRLDLSQAESVLQLVESRTAAAADSALAGLKGGIGDEIRSLRKICIDLVAELEARLDFEEDLPEVDKSRLASDVAALQHGIECTLKTAQHGRLLRQGLQVAIVGRPNVGKSSLLNAWTGTDRAIVTAIPGTTRDIVEAGVTVNGVPVTLLDTAGIWDGSNIVEQIGIERSSKTALAADIVLMVIDAAEGWMPGDAEVFHQLWGKPPSRTSSANVKGPAILVANKMDKAGDFSAASLPLVVKEQFGQIVTTCALESKGLDALEDAMMAVLGVEQVSSQGHGWAVNQRQCEALVRAHESLMKVSETINQDLPIDFWTIDLRGALVSLGEVTGDEVTEEILDAVFGNFCIGK
ncbi:unnamed protein product [Ostreobium quekettii]|uniref:TrmE-type G domain-containing protein n=1 Tax=Ostreobium quekettii TaxID=121088 RepID=A0A8S1IWV0_9CHLO|nr:unnamed protein product [Ostreobium quekettii]